MSVRYFTTWLSTSLKIILRTEEAPMDDSHQSVVEQGVKLEFQNYKVRKKAHHGFVGA